MHLEPLEVAVLAKLLDGEHPMLAALRLQLPALSVIKRERTGVGFYTSFSVSPVTLRAPLASVRFGDVEASIPGLAHGAGFLLYVDDGLLQMLEAYSYDEAWPQQVTEFSLAYSTPDRTAELAKLR
jgi:hypothetical protein